MCGNFQISILCGLCTMLHFLVLLPDEQLGITFNLFAESVAFNTSKASQMGLKRINLIGELAAV